LKPLFVVFALVLLAGGAYLISLGGESAPMLALPLVMVGGILLVLVGVDLVRNRIR
jgi:hypothetical protein